MTRDVYILMLGVCDYVRLHDKRELSLHMELSLLISWPGEGESSWDNPGGPNVITGVFTCGRGRQNIDALGESLHQLLKTGGSQKPRKAGDPQKLEKAREPVLS